MIQIEKYLPYFNQIKYACAILAILLGSSFFQIDTALAQFESEVQQSEQAARYINQIGQMAEACVDRLVYDPSILQSCMSVINEFNKHMKELFSTHGDTINSILFE